MISTRATYCAVCRLETLQLRQGLVLPQLLRNGARLDQVPQRGDGNVPQLVVLLVQQHDQPRRLRVEGAGHVLDGIGHELLDLRVRHGAVLAQLVVGAAGLGQLDQGVGGRHGDGGGREGSDRSTTRGNWNC